MFLELNIYFRLFYIPNSRIRPNNLSYNTMIVLSEPYRYTTAAVGRGGLGVDYITWGLGFKSSHRQVPYQLFSVNRLEKAWMKQKRLRMDYFKNVTQTFQLMFPKG